MQPVLRNIGDNMSKKMTGRLTKEQSEVKKSIVAVIFGNGRTKKMVMLALLNGQKTHLKTK